MTKRILALLLCLCLCLSLLPAALAEDIEIVDTEDEIVIVDEPEVSAPSPDEINAVADGSCGDNLSWTLFDNGLLQIYGVGAMTDYSEGTAPWYSYRDQISDLTLTPEISAIGTYAFYGCSKLNFSSRQGGHALPEQLTKIGRYAFYGCSSLSYVCIPSGVTLIGGRCFDGCTGLKRATIMGAPSFGAYSFGGCTKLTEISFLGDAPDFSAYSFDGSAAGTVWYPGDNSTWVSSKFQNYGSAGLSWTPGIHGWCGDKVSWDYDVVTGCMTLSGSGETWSTEGVVFLNNQNRYPQNYQSYVALRDSILSVDVGQGITSLGRYLFNLCRYLKSVKLPTTLTAIDAGAFSLCFMQFEEIDIPASVVSLEASVFNGSTSLKRICFYGNAPSIGSGCFTNVTATAWYPASNSTWTSSVRQNYGGTITWKAMTKGSLIQNQGALEIPICYSERLRSSSGEHLVWFSSDESIASVDQNGLVKALQYGRVTVTARSADGSSYDTREVQTRFRDVLDTSKYYYTPVYWAADNNITVGYTSGEYYGMFGVGQDCERRQVMIFLWRFAGSPTKDKNGKAYGDARTMFNDLSEYGPSSGTNKAIAWGYKEGIVKGYTDGGFHPTASIVRKDVMIMLYRLAGKPAVSGKLTWPDCQEYSTSSDTYKAILWGSQNKITNGYSSGEYAGNFGTKVNCLREQIVTFLYRARNLV